MLRETQQPDADWNWAYKLQLAVNDERYEVYGMELEALLQGVILLETQWHRSWLPQRFPLVYVEYLASAPWNRRLIEDPPYLVGVGRALLLFARQRSLELGYGGRVGLHSLPGAEAFYHRYQMPDYGPDPDKGGLVYFEYAAFTL
uniref:GNAT family N-acetyltransferase n=1 Tax=Lyngbya confervoides BDU141951 TaxID=1574623 RepID=A0A8T6QJ72_9CYAN